MGAIRVLFDHARRFRRRVLARGRMKMMLRAMLPLQILTLLRAGKRLSVFALRRSAESLGYVIARKSDYYSPLPSEFELRKTITRWNKPSSLIGVNYDLSAMKRLLSQLVEDFYDEFVRLPPHSELQTRGYGWGYTHVDAFLLYAMIRQLKPARYLEIGSGLSTYYCSLAAKRNADEGYRTQITCVEPFPFEALYRIDGINIIQSLVQDVPLDMFHALDAGDVLFIDSSHIIRIDGDVPFLFLEVLPRLGKDVQIQVHDIPFPYNVPFPADYWVLTHRTTSGLNWPFYWNEAMLLQALLAFNQDFEIEMSCPMIRYFDESYLRETLPLVRPVAEEPNTFSSIWLKRVRAPRKTAGAEGPLPHA
jgi:Methyltransferase domain